MLGYLLPIRKVYCDRIFKDQRKFFEFRKHFDAGFSGRCFVYESGTDGRKKVIGYFDTERIGFIEPGKLVPEDFDSLLDSLPSSVIDDVLSYGEPIFAVPIIRPVRYKNPLSLEEFSSMFNLDKVWTRPPQSRARIDWHGPDSLEIEPVETTMEGVRSPFKL